MLGNQIKIARTAKGISQGEFADLIGISRTSLSQIENGVKKPRNFTLSKVAEILFEGSDKDRQGLINILSIMDIKSGLEDVSHIPLWEARALIDLILSKTK